MPKLLSEDQVTEYGRDGLLFPIPVLSSEEAREGLKGFQMLAEALGGRPATGALKHLHLFHVWAYKLATNPKVLDAIEDILGPDILVHSSSVFCKFPGDGAYVSWHQDGYYYGLDELAYCSAWIALTDSSPDNGCMRVLAGSHADGMIKHLPSSVSERNMLGNGMEVTISVNEADATDVVLQCGEMSLHHVAIVHGSNPNASNRPRIGYAIRYVSPRVAQTLDHFPVILARGRDTFRHFLLAENPPSEQGPVSLSNAIQAQADLLRWILDSRERQLQ